MRGPGFLEQKHAEYTERKKREEEERKRQEEEKRAREEKEKLEREQKLEAKRLELEKQEVAQKARKKKITLITVPAVVVVLLCVLAFVLIINPGNQYNAAVTAGLEYLQDDKLTEAREKLVEAQQYENKSLSSLMVNNAATDQIVLLDQYESALQLMKDGDYYNAYLTLEKLGDYHDAATKATECQEKLYNKAEEQLKNGKVADAYDAFVLLANYSDASDRAGALETDYQAATASMKKGEYSVAKTAFEALKDYRDSAAQAEACRKQISYADGITALAQGDYEAAGTAFANAAGLAEADTAGKTLADYQSAIRLYDEGKYTDAQAAFTTLGDYQNAAAMVTKCMEQRYKQASENLKNGKIQAAYDEFADLGTYLDAGDQTAAIEADYQAAATSMKDGEYATAKTAFEALKDYSDSADQAKTCDNQINYAKGLVALEQGDYETAKTAFESASGMTEADTAAKALADYQSALSLYTEGKYTEARTEFAALGDYLDASDKVQSCYGYEYAQAQTLMEEGKVAVAHDAWEAISAYSDSADRAASIENDYTLALEAADKGEWKNAAELFKNLKDYKDSAEQLKTACRQYADACYADGDKKTAEHYYATAIGEGEPTERLNDLRKDLATEAMDEKNYGEALRLYLLLPQTDEIKALEYKLAQTCYDDGQYDVALNAYETLGQYELSVSKLPVVRYAYAGQLFDNGEYRKAQEQFLLLGETSDSAERANECIYQLGKSLLSQKEYDEAGEAFAEVADYKDSAELVKESSYQKAVDQMGKADYTSAKKVFEELGEYSDAKEQIKECEYQIAKGYLNRKAYATAEEKFAALGSYSDSATQANLCRYEQGEAAYKKGEYLEANLKYGAAGTYSDAASKAEESLYLAAEALYNSGDYAAAEPLYTQLTGYGDADAKTASCRLEQGKALMSTKDYNGALSFLSNLSGDDAVALTEQCYITLGNQARIQGDHAQAIAEYRKALPSEDARKALYDMGNDFAVLNAIPKAIECLWAAEDYEPAKNLLTNISEQQSDARHIETSLIAFYAASDQTAEATNDVSGDLLKQTLTTYTLIPDDEFINFIWYRYGNSLLDLGEVDKAKDIFQKLNSYQDSADLVQECDYRKAKDLFNVGKYEEAITAFEALDGYGDSLDQIAACRSAIKERDYATAMKLLTSEKYAEAYAILRTLKGYKDVDTTLADERLKAAALEEKYAVGNYVTFGTYPHNKSGNDATDIEWLVIDRDGQKVLLVSQYALDCQPYNTKKTNVTWETCTLRKWLNGTFFNKAFNLEEQNCIITTTVDNSKNQGNSKWSIAGGKNTQDKVFLLSYAEAEKYFKDDDARMCAPTDYAVAQGGYTNSKYKVDGRPTGWWWLRSPGSSSSSAARVFYTGWLGSSRNVYSSNVVVRPALWINLESGIF